MQDFRNFENRESLDFLTQAAHHPGKIAAPAFMNDDSYPVFALAEHTVEGFGSGVKATAYPLLEAVL